MTTYTKAQTRKKEKSERLRGEGDETKFIGLGFERGQAVGYGNGRRRQDFPKLFIFGMNDHLRDCFYGQNEEQKRDRENSSR